MSFPFTANTARVLGIFDPGSDALNERIVVRIISLMQINGFCVILRLHTPDVVLLSERVCLCHIHGVQR